MRIAIVRFATLICLLAGLASHAAAFGVPGVAAEPELTEREHARLKTRVDERWRVVPTREGLLLVPRQPSSIVKGIELTGALLYADGRPVSGAELYRTLGADAETVLELSYLTPKERIALFVDSAAQGGAAAVERPRSSGSSAADVEGAAPAVGKAREPHYTHGARVRVGGGVTVQEDEQVADAVAVFGGADVRGLVTGNLVAIGGDIKLGPKAVVRGNVFSFGGRVEAEPGAVIAGDTSELSALTTNLRWWDWDGQESVSVAVRPDWPRIARIAFYLGLASTIFLTLLCGAVLTTTPDSVARARAELRGSPIAAFLVGSMVHLLIVPLLVTLTLIFSISIIGIPLLAIVPMIACFIVLGAVIGFTGVAQAIGEVVTGRRVTRGVSLLAGLLLLWGLGMAGRYLWMTSGGSSTLGIVLLLIGTVIESLVWTLGLGAATMAAMAKRRARKAAAAAGKMAPPPITTAEGSSAFSEL